MSESSPSPEETARKTITTVLQVLATPGRGVAIATAMGTSESTISRFKSEHLENFARILAYAGLRVVSSDKVCVDPLGFDAVSYIAQKAMADPDVLNKLMRDR